LLLPVLPADVTQFYLAVSGPNRGEIEYQPRVLGVAEVTFVIDKRRGLQHTQTFQLLARPPETGHPVDWDRAEVAPNMVASGPAPQARWAGVPSVLDTGRKLKSLEKAFTDWLYGARKLPLFENRTLGLVSNPGEKLEAFRDRCRAAAGQQAQHALEMEKVKFGPKFEALGMTLPEEPVQKTAGFWSGLVASVKPVSKAPSGPPASRQEEKQRKLAADYQSKKNEIFERWKRAGEEYTTIEVKPRKADVRVTHFGLAWTPYWFAGGVPAYR
jgi:hypothetical protein